MDTENTYIIINHRNDPDLYLHGRESPPVRRTGETDKVEFSPLCQSAILMTIFVMSASHSGRRVYQK